MPLLSVKLGGDVTTRHLTFNGPFSLTLTPLATEVGFIWLARSHVHLLYPTYARAVHIRTVHNRLAVLQRNVNPLCWLTTRVTLGTILCKFLFNMLYAGKIANGSGSMGEIIVNEP